MKGCYQDDRSGNALFTKIIAQEKCVFTEKAVHERIYSKMIFYERYFYQDVVTAKTVVQERSGRAKNVYYQVVSSSKGFKAKTVAQAKYFNAVWSNECCAARKKDKRGVTHEVFIQRPTLFVIGSFPYTKILKLAL